MPHAKRATLPALTGEAVSKGQVHIIPMLLRDAVLGGVWLEDSLATNQNCCKHDWILPAI